MPVIVADFGERHRHRPYIVGDPRTNALLDLVLRYAPYGLLLVINLGLLGLTGLALLNQMARLLMPESLDPTGRRRPVAGRGRRLSFYGRGCFAS